MVSPNSQEQCSPRIQRYRAKTLEAFLTRDVRSLEAYGNESSPIPVCPKDKSAQNNTYFGCNGCTICPACHHDPVRGTTLAAAMPLQGHQLTEKRMCELYSLRMQRLYAKACMAKPPDPAALPVSSVQRRAIYDDVKGQKKGCCSKRLPIR